MDFQILGSFEVLDADGSAVRIPAGRERALLALLLINGGRVVSVDAIVDTLWGGSPPDTAAKAVQGYVSHLRRIVPETILTRAPGYVLEVPDGCIDAARFAHLAGEGRHLLDEGDDAAAADALEEALALWRGPALADFAYEEFAQDEIRRLEEARLAAVEDRAEALLRVGRTAGLAGELDALVATHPLRERLRSLAMLALYREGRQADALELYEKGRRSLATELGVDPGPELARTHRLILNQDSALGGPPRDAPSAPVVPEPVPASPRVRRRRALILAGAAIALVVVAVAVLALTRDSGGVTIHVPGVVAIDPATNQVVASVTVGSRPVAIAADDTGVWVGDGRDGTITRIDPATHEVTRTAGIGAPAVDLALGAGSLWAATGGFGEVLRIDPELVAVTNRIPLGPPDATEAPTVQAIAANDATVWAGAQGGLVPIDAASGEPRAPIGFAAASALAISVGGDAVWATTLRQRAKRVEAGSDQVTADFYAGTFILPVAVDGDAVWVGAADEGRLWRLDAATGATQLTTEAGEGSDGIAAGFGAVWVTSWSDGTVVRVDRQTGRPTTVIPVGGAPEDVAVGGGLVWVVIPESPPH